MIKVQLGATKILYNLTASEKAKIKDDLMLQNPAYVQAQKYSIYNRISIKKYIEYFDESNGYLSVPRGYKIPFEHEIISDERFTLENVEYPKPLITLRKTQQEAIESYLMSREEGNGVIVIPTGKGKSILGLSIAGKLKQRALVIVHKDDLIDGWKKDAKILYGLRPKQVGLIKGKEFRLGKWITLATIQTLSKLPPEKLQTLREYFSMIIVDEFHHSAAKIYELVNTFPAKDRIGLTATAMRNDGLEKVLYLYFGDVAYQYIESEDDEDIISAQNVYVIVKESNIIYNPPDKYVYPNTTQEVDFVRWTDSRGQHVMHIDYLDEQTKRRLVNKGVIKKLPLNYHKVMDVIDSNEEFNIMVAKDIISEYSKQKSCLVFCREKEHVRYLKDLLVNFGVPENTILLYYGDNNESKEIMKKKAESGECLITIATYAIATEGTNVKRWERIFLAMTFNNPKDAIQAIGRGRRKREGKDILVIYDYRHPFVKGVKKHGETRDKVYKELGFKINFQRQKFIKGWFSRD